MCWGHRLKPCEGGWRPEQDLLGVNMGTGRLVKPHHAGQAPAGSVPGPGSPSSGVLSVPCLLTIRHACLC